MPKCFSCDRRTQRRNERYDVPCCKNCEPLQLVTQTEATAWGLTRSQLASLPLKKEERCDQYGHYVCKLVSAHRVNEFASTPVVQDRLRKRTERRDPETVAERRRQRDIRIAKKYPSWRDALLPAAQAMFNLNRYAKHRACRTIDEIYQLKNQFIELLYKEGFCTECRNHTSMIAPQLCRNCSGGINDYGDECDRRGGTGIWREGIERRFIAFRFDIDGQGFAWHQPDHLVGFPFFITASEETGGLAEEKPLEMTKRKMSEGKNIIRYVLTNVRTNPHCAADEMPELG